MFYFLNLYYHYILKYIIWNFFVSITNYLHGENDFAERAKILAGYRLEE